MEEWRGVEFCTPMKTPTRPRIFESDLLDIAEVGKHIGLRALLDGSADGEAVCYTLNQLMKSTRPMAYLLLIDSEAPEVPLLVTYCHYFRISLLRLSAEDISDIKSIISYARLVAIPAESALSTLVTGALGAPPSASLSSVEQASKGLSELSLS